MTKNQYKELVEYLSLKAEKNNKAAKTTWIVGGTLVLFVAVYMTWVVGSLSSMINNPQELADVVIGNVEEAVPGYLEDTKVYLESQAPVIAEQVRTQIFDIFPKYSNFWRGGD